MFLTRMALDVNRRGTQQALADPVLLQHAVEHAFGGHAVHALWRLEQLNHRLHLILLSPLRPTLGPAHQQYGYPGAFPSWETWSIEDDLSDLRAGQRLHFRLCAATSPAIPQPESLRRMAHEDVSFQMAWLKRCGGQSGFTFAEHDVVVLHSEWITWRDPDAPGPLACHQVTFDGEMTVADPGLLREAITEGIGEYLRMGAGLMTVDVVYNYRYV